MAINARGTKLFFYDGTTVHELGCPTGLGSISGERSVNETAPCLGSGSTTKFAGGLTWGNLEPTINFDPSDASHKKAWDMFNAGDENIPFIIVFSDGTGTPTWGSSDWAALTTRSTIKFTGSFSAAGIEFADANSAVGGTLSIVVNAPVLTPKA